MPWEWFRMNLSQVGRLSFGLIPLSMLSLVVVRQERLSLPLPQLLALGLRVTLTLILSLRLPLLMAVHLPSRLPFPVRFSIGRKKMLRCLLALQSLTFPMVLDSRLGTFFITLGMPVTLAVQLP